MHQQINQGQNTKQPPMSFKVILLGDSNVGKTSLVKQFVQGQYTGKEKSTIHIDYITKTVQIDEFTVRLNIFDTAGQERFKSLTRSYLKGTDAVLFVYAMDSKSSLKNIDNWVEFFEKQSECREQVRVLVGAKKDIIEQIQSEGSETSTSIKEKKTISKQINKEELKQVLERNKMTFKFETSAKLNKNINVVFEQLARNLIYNNFKKKRLQFPIQDEEWSIILKRDKQHLMNDHQRDKSKCC